MTYSIKVSGPKRIIIFVFFWVAELARVVISRIPARICYSLASIIGDGVYYAWPRGRRNMIKSIANILHKKTEEGEVRRTARSCMRNYCKYCVDMLRYSYSKKDSLINNIEIAGRQHLDAALKEGHGVILVSFHMGNLDLGINILTRMGYPVNAVVRDIGAGQFDKFIEKPRAQAGVKLISPKDGAKKMLEALKQNEVLALMIDSPKCEKGVLIKLGSTLVLMPSGAAKLALRTGAKIIPCGLFRSSNTRFQGIIGQPIDFQPAGKIALDARELTQRAVNVLEGMVLAHTDQWYVFHPLIKDNLAEVNLITEKL